ncbi:ShlB/FhaC/HecB family hemolysin secretion/activation protein, partial [Pseudomonas aeruginosa]|uniref:ShlB/FhaC/HecB family hemolysin secretion/activation protein n=1 Tax=Pseudomonas aeruginosa TaxID=287 RepID=UPI00255CCF8C
RLPSRQAQLELVPGSEVGGSRVRLKGERDKPWRVSATRNNDGDVNGDSRSHQFRAERVLHRDGVSKTAMSLGLSHQRTNNYGTRITETQLGFNHGRRIGSGFVNLDLGWQQGIGALGA